MSLIRITEPASYCVSIADIKDFVRLRGSTAEDYLFRSVLQAAESYAENYMKRSIMRQQWRLTLDAIPADDVIELLRPPLSTVTTAVSAFTYTGTTGGTITMPATAYDTDTASEPPRLYLAYDSVWPSDIRGHKDVIKIDYWTGYADKAGVPEGIKTWVKLRAAAYYENREAVMVGTGNFIDELPRSFVDGLLDEYSIITVV